MGLMKSKKGFTLIEVLVVVGIVSIIVPAVFGLFFAHLRAQSKVILLQEVKNNGDGALSIIEELVKRNAVSVHSATPPVTANEVCATSGSSYSSTMYFLDRNGDYFNFSLSSGKIASASSIMSTVNLTNDKVQVTDFTLTCSRSSTYTEPLISISFTVSQANTASSPEQSASLSYQTKMKLRP